MRHLRSAHPAGCSRPDRSRGSIEGQRRLPEARRVRGLLEARWSWSCSNAGLKKAPRSGSKRIDRLTLPAAVVMIDAIALIMPEEEAGANQIRHCTADVRLARRPDARADLCIERTRGFIWISREDTLPCHFIANTLDERHAAWITVAHRRQSIAQPIPDCHLFAFIPDERSCAAIGPSRLGDKVEYHEGVTWTRRAVRKDVEQTRHIERAVVPSGVKGGFQHRNESSTWGTKSESPNSRRSILCHV